MTSPHPTDPTRRRRPCVAVGIAALALLGAACTDDADWSAAGLGEPVSAPEPGAEDPTVSAPSWLFVLSAPAAVSSDAGDTVQVTVSDPGNVLAFTDRPARDAQFVRAEWLAGHWRDLFSADPPNAVLTARTADGQPVEVPVEVLSLDGDAAELTVTLSGLDGPLDELPAAMVGVQLFVDDVIVPSDATDWTFHSIVTPRDSDRYVARTKLAPDAVDSDQIYSFPAIALIGNFQDHQPPAAPSTGPQLQPKG